MLACGKCHVLTTSIIFFIVATFVVFVSLPRASLFEFHSTPVTRLKEVFQTQEWTLYPGKHPNTAVAVGWTTRPDRCSNVYDVFESGETHGEPADVRVLFCNTTVPTNSSPRYRADDVVICVPPLYGELRSHVLTEWFAWYSSLGIHHFILYSIDIALKSLNFEDGDFDLEWVRVDWIKDMRSWQRGQLWAINDCLHRARSRGAHWGLFLDVDEFLHLNRSLPSLLVEMRQKRLDQVTFGRRNYLADICEQRLPETWNNIGNFPGPDCEERPGVQHNAYTCPSFWGRRKFLLNLLSVEASNIHESRAQYILHMNASDHWLMHCRGSATDPDRHPVATNATFYG